MGIRILLVEGNDDQHVMWNLFQCRRPSSEIYVLRPGDDLDAQKPGWVKRAQPENGEVDDGGDKKLLDSIPARLDTSGLQRLAVVIDANDKGPEARWEAIRQRLKNEGYSDLPKSLDQTGVVIDFPGVRGRRPIRFGVWVMPDNRSKGMLEDFVAKLIPDNDEMRSPVDNFLASIPQGKRRFPPQHQPKAWIHLWLAVSKKPGRPMGQAIKADRQLDANSPTVEPFLKWINDALITDGEQP